MGVSSLTQKSLVNTFTELKDKIICISNGVDCKKYDVDENQILIRKSLIYPTIL